MFSDATREFLVDLAANNNRAWFDVNKPRYEALVREPALAFIDAMAPVLNAFAANFRADARKVGGSLMRVYRDTRFSPIKTPFKTNIGIQFRHQLGKDVHAPAFYVHLASDECFLALGCWHPDPAALGRIRERLAEYPEAWCAARDEAAFARQWALAGDRLQRPPRGYAADHPVIGDIKRKDFIAVAPLSWADATAPGLAERVGEQFATARTFMQFLCAAQGVAY
jgi:uncharacterized protein (TIGR02453 family)